MREAKEKHFLNKPVYEGGRSALLEFVKKNLKYPKLALENKIEGVVIVRYTINKEGKVIKTDVKNSLGYGCDEEAERVVRLLKFHVPKNRKIKVIFHKKIHIRFSLPKKKPNPLKLQISYSNSEKETMDKKSSYEYTIEF